MRFRQRYVLNFNRLSLCRVSSLSSFLFLPISLFFSIGYQRFYYLQLNRKSFFFIIFNRKRVLNLVFEIFFNTFFILYFRHFVHFRVIRIPISLCNLTPVSGPIKKYLSNKLQTMITINTPVLFILI